MKSIYSISIIISCFLLSCANDVNEITYKYKNTEIKRLDYAGETVFYYQQISDSAPKFGVEYSGMNDGFSGYLKFNPDGKVELLSGDGYFVGSNEDTSKFVYKRIRAHERPELKDNVCIVKLGTRYERDENSKFNSDVKTQY